MTEIFVVCNNLLDSSKIREALKGKQVSVYRDHLKMCEAIKGNVVTENITIVLDYYCYEKIGINEVLSDIRDFINSDVIVEYISFVPHEKMDSLNEQAREVTYVPRSKFFKNIASYTTCG